MNKTSPLLIFLFFFCTAILCQTHIRLNLNGFKPDGLKRAVVISKDTIEIDSFEIIDFFTDKTVFRSTDISDYGEWGNFKSTFRLRFDNLREKGIYYISAGGTVSPIFRISEDIYDGSVDFILNYMRQQRCGFNPFLKDSCHTHDGFIIYNPEYDSSFSGKIRCRA